VTGVQTWLFRSLETQAVAPSRWDIDSAQRPYPIFQQGGAYFSTPDFLNTAHTINNAEDAEAYLARLSQFPTVLDNDTAEQRAQAARGFLAPAWSIDLTLGQMRKLRGVPAAQNTMVESIARRTAAKGIAGDWASRAAEIVDKSIYPALDRQIAAMEQLKAISRPGDGAWRLTNGEAIYAEALKVATTTNFTPAEVHQLGLAQVAEISAELKKILRGQGYTQGSVAQRLDALNHTPAQRYADSDAGRAELLAYLNAVVKDMYGRLPQAFAQRDGDPVVGSPEAQADDGRPFLLEKLQEQAGLAFSGRQDVVVAPVLEKYRRDLVALLLEGCGKDADPAVLHAVKGDEDDRKLLHAPPPRSMPAALLARRSAFFENSFPAMSRGRR
jgi:uncharacterized protein (DUF885 family)